MDEQRELNFTPPADPLPKPDEMRFDGKTYEPKKDKKRLTGQAKRVFDLMRDGRWRTLSEIQNATGGSDSEAGISARLRDFRKAPWGSHTVNRRRRGEDTKGLFEYQLILKFPV